MDSVFQLRWELLRKRDDEMPIEPPSRHTRQGVDPVRAPPLPRLARSPTGRAHPCDEFALAEPGLGAQVVDQLAQCEILLDRGARLVGRWPALVLAVIPTGVVRRQVLLHRFRAALSSAARRARSISLRRADPDRPVDEHDRGPTASLTHARNCSRPAPRPTSAVTRPLLSWVVGTDVRGRSSSAR